jgi:hypothetical protein
LSVFYCVFFLRAVAILVKFYHSGCNTFQSYFCLKCDAPVADSASVADIQVARVGRLEEEGRVGLAAEQLGHVSALARLQQQVLDDGALGVLWVALGEQPLGRRRQQHAVAEPAAAVAAAPLGAADAQVQRLGAVLLAAQKRVRQTRRF